MNVFLVKVFNDIENNYQGIDDFKTTVCRNEETAKMVLSNELDDTLKYFKDTYNEGIDDLEYEYSDDHLSFSVDNGRDYISGKIEEKEVL